MMDVDSICNNPQRVHGNSYLTMPAFPIITVDGEIYRHL